MVTCRITSPPDTLIFLNDIETLKFYELNSNNDLRHIYEILPISYRNKYIIHFIVLFTDYSSNINLNRKQKL